MNGIKLSQQGKHKGKYVVLVDDSDYDWLNGWRWHVVKSGNTFYAQRHGPRINGKQTTIMMHRVIMNTPDDQEVDHQDHNGLNCQRHNMRNATRSQNQMNKLPYGSSIYLGVSNHRTNTKYFLKKQNSYTVYTSYCWIAHINSGNKSIHLGCFKTEEEAARAYDRAAKEYHGEFANLNFKN